MLQKIPKSFTITFALLIGLIITGCSDDGSGPDTELNVLETIEVGEQYSMLGNFVNEYKLADTLSQDQPVTVFAPTDDALSSANLDSLSDEEITGLLQYHIVGQDLDYDDLLDTESVETMSGDTLFFSSENDTLLINGSYELTSDASTEASNGMLFNTDTLLTPSAQ